MEPILCIAPFGNIGEIAKKLIADMGLGIPVIVANNEEALSKVKDYPNAVSVVISRGGTATDLKRAAGQTVVEIGSSLSDIMPIVERLEQSGIKKIGVVSTVNLIDDIVRDFTIADVTIFMRGCQDEEEIKTTILELRQQGVEAIIGCKRAIEEAKKCNLRAEFLLSSPSSIKKAINEARRIVNSQEGKNLQVAQLNAVINNINEGIIIAAQDGTISYSNQLAQQVFGNQQVIPQEKVRELLENRNAEKIIDVGGNKLLLRVIPLHLEDKYKGDVITFEEVSRIETIERKVRFSLYQKGLYAKKNFSNIIYKSAVMHEIIAKAERFARTNSNILIYGETGTGKEVLAQSIHNHSLCKNGPFVSVNCASIPPSLIESELFGYVEGAFTGARKNGKAGLFELAHGGTIFLDEIGELPLDVQSRLLRVLQEREVMRIGDDKIIPIDIRVLCATNKDLQQLAREGNFRLDLYYRINVLKLRLPALRDRKEDIPLLFNFYLQQFSQAGTKTINTKAMNILKEYAWPGNIRELRNIAEILALYDDNIISELRVAEVLNDVSQTVSQEDCLSVKADLSLKQMESSIVEQLLTRNNPDDVCRTLGISRVTLWRKTKQYCKNER
jgi:transcriptional regulator with PAS, ATPase and Fis domain